MKTVLSNVERACNDKERKLQERIEQLLKSEKREMEGRLRENVPNR